MNFLKRFGEYPPEYKPNVHGSYDPARWYGKRKFDTISARRSILDRKVGLTKLQDRMEISPQPLIAMLILILAYRRSNPPVICPDSSSMTRAAIYVYREFNAVS